jgi:hypothetical protein
LIRAVAESIHRPIDNGVRVVSKEGFYQIRYAGPAGQAHPSRLLSLQRECSIPSD